MSAIQKLQYGVHGDKAGAAGYQNGHGKSPRSNNRYNCMVGQLAAHFNDNRQAKPNKQYAAGKALTSVSSRHSKSARIFANLGLGLGPTSSGTIPPALLDSR